VDALASASDRPKEIRIYTDGQRPLLSDPEALRRLARAHPEIVIRPVLVGGDPEANLGIVSLETAGGIPAPGRPLKIHAKVLNASASEALNVPLEFTLNDGTPAGSLTIPKIAPGATTEAVFPFAFAEAGPQAITAALPADALTADNHRALALDVARRKDVLVVNPASPTAGFVAKAVAPVAAEDAGKFFLAPLMSEASELPALLGKDERPFAIVLCEAGALPQATVDLLDSYVSTGGNLLVFPKEQAEAWALGKLLPATLAGEATGTELTWQGRGLTHAVSRFWNDPANGTLGSVTLARHFPMQLQGGEAVIALSDGTPGVVLGRHGAGSVVLFAAPLDSEWTNLPLHPAFVPFFQRVLGELDRSGQGGLNLRPGEIFRETLPPEQAGKNFTLRLPAPHGERSGGALEASTEGAVLRFEDTWPQGVYQASIDGEVQAVFAVNLDPEESRLEPIPTADFAEWTNVPREAVAGTNRTVVLKDFLPMLLWTLAGLALVECFMAYRVTMAR